MSSMYDKELIVEIFRNIAWSIEQITKRFKPCPKEMVDYCSALRIKSEKVQ